MVKTLAQKFSCLERKLRIPIEIDHRDAGLGFDGPLGKGRQLGGGKIALVIHWHHCPRLMRRRLSNLVRRCRVNLHRQ